MNEKGMTLIEVLASIVILSIIVVSLLTFFVQSSRTNAVSKNIISATYVAEKALEEVYEPITKTYMLSDFITANPTGYTLLTTTNTTDSIPVKAVYEKNESNYNIKMELESAKNSPLVKVKVKVYKDGTKKEAQMEMLLSWKKIGI